MRHTNFQNRRLILSTAMLLISSLVLVIGCSENPAPVQSSSAIEGPVDSRDKGNVAQTTARRTVDRDLETWPPTEDIVTLEELYRNPEVYDGRRIGFIGAPNLQGYSCDAIWCRQMPCCVDCLGIFKVVAGVEPESMLEITLKDKGGEVMYCAGSICDFEKNCVECYPFPKAFGNVDYWFVGVFEDRTPEGYPHPVFDLHVEHYGILMPGM